jgi:hypothetical protein
MSTQHTALPARGDITNEGLRLKALKERGERLTDLQEELAALRRHIEHLKLLLGAAAAQYPHEGLVVPDVTLQAIRSEGAILIDQRPHEHVTVIRWTGASLRARGPNAGNS